MPYTRVLDTCPDCRVESALVAHFDAESLSSMLGIASRSRCRLCGRESVGDVFPECEIPDDSEQRMLEDRCPSCGDPLDEVEHLVSECATCGISANERVVRRGTEFDSLDDLRGALDRWAAEEGRRSADAFVEASFPDGSLEEVYKRLMQGETVETRLDVLTPLLEEEDEEEEVTDEMQAPVAETVDASDEVEEPEAEGAIVEEARSTVPSREAKEEDTEVQNPTTEVSPPATESDIPLDHVAIRLLPLVSVMMADGKRHSSEEAFIQGILDAVHAERIPEEFFRTYPPSSLPKPDGQEDRIRMIEAMVHLVHVDRHRSGREMRVVRDFARAWEVSGKKVTFWDKKYRQRYAKGLLRLRLLVMNAVL